MNIQRYPKIGAATLTGLIAALLFVGAGIGVVTDAGKGEWYNTLVKSPLTPPGWVFGVVWPILYIMMAVSFWLVLRAGAPYRSVAVRLFMLQLVLNWGWSFVFFTFHQVALAFGWILLLIGVVLVLVLKVWPMTRWGAVLLLPYLMWLSFAAYLTGCILIFNETLRI